MAVFSLLLLGSTAVQADANGPSSGMPGAQLRNLPLSSVLHGNSYGATDGEARFQQLAGSDYANIAAGNPYIFYSSLLGVPKSTNTRQANNVMVASATSAMSPQVVVPPAPVPLPPALLLMLSGVVVLFRWMKPARRTAC